MKTSDLEDRVADLEETVRHLQKYCVKLKSLQDQQRDYCTAVERTLQVLEQLVWIQSKFT